MYVTDNVVSINGNDQHLILALFLSIVVGVGPIDNKGLGLLFKLIRRIPLILKWPDHGVSS